MDYSLTLDIILPPPKQSIQKPLTNLVFEKNIDVFLFIYEDAFLNFVLYRGCSFSDPNDTSFHQV